MSDYISDEVYKALEGTMQIPNSAFLLQELSTAVPGSYNTIAVALSYGLAMDWVAGDTSTVAVNDIPYPVRRYERMMIVYEVFDVT